MLTVHLSNRYEVLEEALLERLDQRLAGLAGLDPTAAPALGTGVLVPETVIVPSAAIRQAVTLALARRRGICAQIEFDFPARWIWRQIARLVPQVGAESPLAPARLTWRLFGALGDADLVSEHPRLAHYLAHADPVMRLELAESLAQLFDQYVTYRPEWLSAWAQGKCVLDQTRHTNAASLRDDELWQRVLWQHISRKLGLETRHPAQHFVERLGELDTAAVRAAGLPDEVHVFAVPTLPALHLGLLKALGRHAQVHLYSLNPCQEFWLDVPNARDIARRFRRGLPAPAPEGNALVTAWGGQTQSQLALLYDGVDEHLVDEPDYRPPEGSHLLAQLQRRMLEFEPLLPGSLSLDPSDRSVEVHACHSLLRQIEVLHETLLGCFADPGLKASDVLVVVPDLEAAAPLIEAVFGTAPPSRRLPYEITGRARSRVNTCARALLGLLRLAGSRFKASEVLAWISQPLVTKKFHLDEEALARIAYWIDAAGIRWGRDAEHRAALGATASAAFTFAQGLDRLLLGYALGDRIEDTRHYLAQDLPWPAGHVAGSDAALLGRWWRLLAHLRAFDEACTPASGAQWGERLSDALERFFEVRGEAVADLIDLRETLQALFETIVVADIEEALPLEVIRAALERALTESARGGVASGGITFASLASLRALPYRVIAILGMDDGVFPSQRPALEYDLMQAAPRLGDRQRRHDDRNLLLDLVMAARDRLFIAYTGMSQRENTSLPASTVVSELLDALVASDQAPSTRERLWIAHPLQPFSPACFDPGADPRLRSHDEALAAALRASANPDAGDADPDDAPPDVDPPDVDPPDVAPLVDPLASAKRRAVDPVDGRDDDPADHGGDESGGEWEGDSGEDWADPGPQTWQSGPAFFRTPLPPVPEAACRLTQAALVEFLRLPARYWLEKRLGLAFPYQEPPLVDEEPIFPGYRDGQRLAKRLLRHLLEAPESDLDAAWEGRLESLLRLAASGTELPDTPLAALASERLLKTLLPIARQARAALADPSGLTVPPTPALTQTLEFEFGDERWTLSISLEDLGPSGLALGPMGLVHVQANPLWPSDWLKAWVHHLCLGVLKPPGLGLETRLIAPDTDERLQPLGNARETLRELVGLYRKGLREPLPFFPRSAWAYTEKARLGDARSKWLGRPGSRQSRASAGESADPAIRIAFRDREPASLLDGRFRQLAKTVFEPLRKSLDCSAP